MSMQPESRNENNFDSPAYECGDFEQRIHHLLDDRRAPEADDQLRARAELSETDSELLAGQEVMLQGLDVMDVPELPPEFAQRCVVAAISPVPQPRTKVSVPGQAERRSPSWTSLALTFAGAAVLLIAMFGISNWLTEQPPASHVAGVPNEDTASEDSVPEDSVVSDSVVTDSVEEKLESPNSTPAHDAEDALQQSEKLLAADAGQAERTANEDSASNFNAGSHDAGSEAGVSQDADQTADPYHGIAELFPKGLRERLPSADSDENLYDLRPKWVDHVAGGFRPVADSVGGAINLLRRNIGPAGKDQPSEKPQPQARTPRGHVAASLS